VGQKVFTSDTGELTWNLEQPEAGYLAVNTPNTKLFTGYPKGRTVALGGVQLSIGKTRLDWATVSLVSRNATGFGESGRAAGFADAEEVFAKALANDGRARAIVDRAIGAAATALWTIIHSLLPERVILGGGVMEAHYDLFAGPLQEVMRKATLGPSTGMQVCQAQLQNDAGLVGAGFLAMRESLRK
jgi:hypothetical protein